MMYVRRCITLCLLLGIGESRLLYHRSLEIELSSESAPLAIPEPHPIVKRSKESSINTDEERSNLVHNSGSPTSDISKRAFGLGGLFKSFPKNLSKFRSPKKLARKPVSANGGAQTARTSTGASDAVANTGSKVGGGQTNAVQGGKENIQGGNNGNFQGGNNGNGGAGGTGAILAGSLASTAPLLAVNAGSSAGGAGGLGADPSLAGEGADVDPTLTNSGAPVSAVAAPVPAAAAPVPGAAAPVPAAAVPAAAAVPVPAAAAAPAVGRRAVVNGAAKVVPPINAQNKDKLEDAREKSSGLKVSRRVRPGKNIKRKRREM